MCHMEAVGTLLTATVVVHISPANPDFYLARSVLLVIRHAMFSQKVRSNRLRFENLLSSQVAFGLIHVRQEAFILHAAFVILRHVSASTAGSVVTSGSTRPSRSRRKSAHASHTSCSFGRSNLRHKSVRCSRVTSSFPRNSSMLLD
jgi:hypothetical protein